MVDEKLLDDAVRLTGERTYSATIHRGLQELVRVSTVREGLKALGGTGWWEGNLDEMREATPITPKRPKRKRRRGSR